MTTDPQASAAPHDPATASGPESHASRPDSSEQAQSDRLGEAAAQEAGAAAASAQPSADAPAPSESSLAERLAEREEQLMRLAAEVENLRKRHAQELTNASKFAIESFAESLLPVADSLETALRLQDQSLENLRAGVELTLKQLQHAFERGRLGALDPKGEKFDPNRHQAVSMVDGASREPAVPSGHVVDVMQKGYLIGERVLRPALVVVAQ